MRKNLCLYGRIYAYKEGGSQDFAQGNQYAVGKEVPGGATIKLSDPALDLIWSRERWGKDLPN